MPEFHIRNATPHDMPAVMAHIKALAEIEQSRHKVTATADELSHWLFDKSPKAFCLVAESDGAVIGYAIYFYNFSTYRGKAGIYIEDIFVQPEFRGHGIGKAFFATLAKLAHKQGMERLQWWAINSNHAAISFYKNMGATPCRDYTVFQLNDDAMRAIINNKDA